MVDSSIQDKKIHTHMEIHSSEGGAVLETMWVEIKGKGNRSFIVVGGDYRLPDQMGGN